MTKLYSVPEADTMHPLLAEFRSRIETCSRAFRQEALATGHGGELLDRLWGAVERDPLSAPVEWVRLVRWRAELAGARRLGRLAGELEALLVDVDSLRFGRGSASLPVLRTPNPLERFDQRRAERVRVVLPVTLSWSGDEFRGACVNLCEGGMLVEASVEPPAGTRFSALIQLGDASHGVRVAARVVWAVRAASTRQHAHLGVEFVDVAVSVHQRISLFIQRLLCAELS